MALGKQQVMQALASVKTDEGRGLVVAGHVQDVLIERHGEDAHVAVLVEADWNGRPPSAAEKERIAAAIRSLEQVKSVKTVARAASGALNATEARRRAAAMRPKAPPPHVPDGARLIAVASGKGGVGKSTVSVNLAVALAREGRRVAIVDCDVYGFSVPMLIGLNENPNIEDRKIVPPRASGVQVVSMDFLVRGNQAVVWRGPMLGKTIRQFMQDVRWDNPEVMVLDLPPGTGDVALDVVTFFPQAEQIVVTTPDPFAARVAERAGRMALDAHHTLLGVVENMAYMRCGDCGHRMEPFGHGGGDAVASALGCDVLARVPFTPPAPGRRSGLFPVDGEIGKAYQALARRVLADGVLSAGGGGLPARSSEEALR